MCHYVLNFEPFETMKNKYKKYFTGYLANNYEIDTNYNYLGKNFIIEFANTANSSKCSINTTYYNKKNEKKISHGCKEIIIYAKNDHDAFEVSKLIYAAFTLLSANLGIVGQFASEPVIEENYNENIKSFSGRKDFYILSTNDLGYACKIACKVTYKKKLKLALIKYYLACSLHSNQIIDLDPHHSENVYLMNYSIFDNVRIGYAIVVFYSVIEELGLEIRASEKKPSIIHGQWNQIVKDDLEKRLVTSKININDPIVWHLRGTPTKIEKEKKPLKTIKSDYSKYDVRDVYIEISDGIRILSWIRSKIVSHKLNNNIKSISIYDVANANFLCRRILLETLKMYGDLEKY